MSLPERIARLTPEQVRRKRRLSLELLWACTAFLLPWSIYLMISLPRSYNTRHYDLAWAGFDVLELLALGATAYFGLRRLVRHRPRPRHARNLGRPRGSGLRGAAARSLLDPPGHVAAAADAVQA